MTIQQTDPTQSTVEAQTPSPVDEFATEVETLLKSTVSAAWPTFSGGQQQAFEQFQSALNSKFGLTLWGDLFKLNASQVAAIDETAKPSNPNDWKAMLGVVDQVLAYKTTIDEAIEGQRVYLLGIQEVLVEVTDQTIKYVGLEQTDPPPPAPFPLSDLLGILLAPASLIPGGIGSAGAGIIKGIIGFAQYFANKGGPDAPDPEDVLNDFTLASLKIQEQMTEQFNNGLNGLTLALNTAVADYGKLQGLAKLLDQPQVVWPQQASGISADGLNQLEIRLWNLFLPARWPILNAVQIPPFEIQATDRAGAESVVEKHMKTWPQSYWRLSGESQRNPWNQPERGWTVRAHTLAEPAENQHRANPRLADGSAKRLFSDLKVPRADVFGQKNGWTGFKKYDITWPISRNAEWVFGS